MQSATGSGKTIMATDILLRAIQRKSSTWFVVPRKELLRQTSGTYDAFGIAHSYIAAGRDYNGYAQSHIVSQQTVVRRLDDLTPPKMAVIDECHYGQDGLDTLIQWLSNAGTYIIGLTATPKKQSGQGFDGWFDDMVMGPSIKELIALGRLSEFKLYAPNRPDLTGIRKVAGEYHQGQLDEWMEHHGKVLVGDAIGTYKSRAMGRLGLTFCTSIKQSKLTAEAFTAEGIPAAHMDGTMSDDVRKAIIRAYADRRLLQLCSVDLMTFGFDLAAQVGRDVVVECMSDLAPTHSESKQLQKWGRVLRRKPEPAMIFDHVGNAFKHGMPDDEREWSLKGRDKVYKQEVDRDAQLRQCTRCYFCHPVAPACPECGFVYPIKYREIKTVAGDLEEVKAIKAAKQKRMEIGMAKTVDDLRRIARERGYKTGWINIIARKKGITI